MKTLSSHKVFDILALNISILNCESGRHQTTSPDVDHDVKNSKVGRTASEVNRFQFSSLDVQKTYLANQSVWLGLPSPLMEWVRPTFVIFVVSFLASPKQHRHSLVHATDELVDEVLPVTKVTTLDEVLELPWAEATGGRGQLEWPEEVAGLLEVGADGVDLVDEVLDADNAELAEVGLDELVVGDGKALLVDLSVAALVDELTDRLQVGVAVRDEGLDDLQHLGRGLGEPDEDTIVDLEETEELEGLALLGVDLVDTGRC
jgi:hypothetical protein